MLRFRIISANDTDTGRSYETAEDAVENCPPGRGVRDSETGKRVDPAALRDEKTIRWF
jgi:hypothetical protein